MTEKRMPVMWAEYKAPAGICQVSIEHGGWGVVVEHHGHSVRLDMEDKIRQAAQVLTREAKDAPANAERPYYRDHQGNWIGLARIKAVWVAVMRAADGATHEYCVSTMPHGFPEYQKAAEALAVYAKLKRWKCYTHSEYLATTSTKEDPNE